MDPSKKISFGFSKTNKKPLIFNKPLDKKVDYIVSLEGQSVKLKDESKEVEKAPLIIPLKDNQKDLLQRVRDMKAKQKNTTKNGNDSIEDNRPDSDLTTEELAAREIVREAKQRLAQNDITASKVFVVPAKNADELPLEGKMESTLVDYENIPVNDFGLAMLRGMGWKEGLSIGKNPVKIAAVKAPDLRPKGLGLGASVLINSETPLQPAIDNKGQALVLKKGCYARIIAGNNKGSYCEVQGLDDEAGRVVVKTSLKSNILTLNEFMLVPVTKEEYSKSSKVINSAMYKEYKEMDENRIKTEIKTEYKEKNSTNTVYKGGSNIKNDEGSDAERKYSIVKTRPEGTNNSSGDDQYYKRSSSKSSSSRDKEKFSRRSRKYKDSSDLDSDHGKSKRVHKRKDKRRHRDKSRSPYVKSKYKNKKSSKSKHRYSSSSDSDYDSRSKSRNDRSSSSGSDYDRHKRRNKR
ncbi:unnamed protein product [Diabrotica balteata]|uniref:G-patch domain-containing protein n=1 Tax=Diabrotica balteata TaxID=107213 RepID=A0A9N9SXL6_DIABA|nr:unnamed protein product [Diabrotica balteata]